MSPGISEYESALSKIDKSKYQLMAMSVFAPGAIKPEEVIRYIGDRKVDSIVYVGSLNMLQVIFIKIPQSKLPSRLYFMGDIIRRNKIDNSFFNLSNWDFGLMNFDVR